MRWINFIVMFILVSPIVLSLNQCEDIVNINETCQMITPILSCTTYDYNIYNQSGYLMENSNLTSLNNSIYYLNFTQPEGGYIIELCDGTTREILSKDEGNKMILGIIILIPLIFGLFMIIGAATLGEDHNILKIVLFLFSPITVWVSFHFAMINIVKYYNLPELQEAMAGTTYWMAWFFFVLVSYFMIYTIWKWADNVAQKKKQRIEY